MVLFTVIAPPPELTSIGPALIVLSSTGPPLLSTVNPSSGFGPPIPNRFRSCTPPPWVLMSSALKRGNPPTSPEGENISTVDVVAFAEMDVCTIVSWGIVIRSALVSHRAPPLTISVARRATPSVAINSSCVEFIRE